MKTARLPALVGGVAAVTAWAALLYGLAGHVYTGHSDNANAILVGHDLVGGNWRLSSWVLPQGNSWSVDVLLFGAWSRLFGMGSSVIYAVPVVIGGLLTGIGIRIAADRRRGAAAVAAGLTVAAFLAFPDPFLAGYLYQAPYHVFTTACCLFAFLAFGQAGRRRWLGLALLSVAMLGDGMVLATGVVPVAAGGVVQAVRQRRIQPFLALGGLAAASLALAFAARSLLQAAGGYELLPPVPFADWSYRFTNLRHLPEDFAALLGVGRHDGLSGLWLAAHGAGLLAVVAGLLRATGSTLSAVLVVRGPHPAVGRSTGGADTAGPTVAPPDDDHGATDGRWLDDVLLLACLGGTAAAMVLNLPPRAQPSRYLLPPVIFAAVLAGRFVATAVAGLRRPQPRALAVAAVAACGVLYLAATVSGVRGPRPDDPHRHLARWLAAHDLRDGVAGYWNASILTVHSGQAVRARPVLLVDGRLRPYLELASRRWFTPGAERSRRQFVVFRAGQSPADGWVSQTAATAAFGPPAEEHDVGPFRVLVWEEDLFSRLGPQFPA